MHTTKFTNIKFNIQKIMKIKLTQDVYLSIKFCDIMKVL